MQPDLLARCQRKYGPRWQTPLARDICRVVPNAKLNPVRRTIQRYAAGDSDPSPISEAAIWLLTEDGQ